MFEFVDVSVGEEGFCDWAFCASVPLEERGFALEECDGCCADGDEPFCVCGAEAWFDGGDRDESVGLFVEESLQDSGCFWDVVLRDEL